MSPGLVLEMEHKDRRCECAHIIIPSHGEGSVLFMEAEGQAEVAWSIQSGVQCCVAVAAVDAFKVKKR